jgi:hypothetical protein
MMEGVNSNMIYCENLSKSQNIPLPSTIIKFLKRKKRTAFQILLAFKFSVEKFVILVSLPVEVTWCFSLTAFNTLSLFYSLNVLVIIGLRIVLFFILCIWSPNIFLPGCPFLSQDFGSFLHICSIPVA